jgi:pyridoxal/pyridoxine/pyridoxamine kinase
LPIASHIATLGLHFDAFYSGYLAGAGQVDKVLTMMDKLCDPQTLVFVDPAFGDHGKLYSLLASGCRADARAVRPRARCRPQPHRGGADARRALRARRL